MNKRDYRDYLLDILGSIDEIEFFIKGMVFEAFSQDKKTINAVVRSIEVIGEASKKIPETIREVYPDVPWKGMAGMRDKLMHEYFGIDLEILWSTAKEEVPVLKTSVQKILKDTERPNKPCGLFQNQFAEIRENLVPKARAKDIFTDKDVAKRLQRK